MNTNTTSAHHKRFTLALMTLSIFVIFCDQITKYWSVATLTRAFDATPHLNAAMTFAEKISRFWHVHHPEPKHVVIVIKNFWDFRYVENPGAAWGFLANSDSAWRLPFFITVSLLAIFFIIVVYKKSSPQQKMLRLALALVLGGAFGNFIDRIRLGYVIDFIDWHWYRHFTWPTFNIADSAISVGVALLLLDMLLNRSVPEETIEQE